jgi:hypothetical protein
VTRGTGKPWVRYPSERGTSTRRRPISPLWRSDPVAVVAVRAGTNGSRCPSNGTSGRFIRRHIPCQRPAGDLGSRKSFTHVGVCKRSRSRSVPVQPLCLRGCQLGHPRRLPRPLGRCEGKNRRHLRTRSCQRRATGSGGRAGRDDVVDHDHLGSFPEGCTGEPPGQVRRARADIQPHRVLRPTAQPQHRPNINACVLGDLVHVLATPLTSRTRPRGSGDNRRRRRNNRQGATKQTPKGNSQFTAPALLVRDHSPARGTVIASEREHRRTFGPFDGYRTRHAALAPNAEDFTGRAAAGAAGGQNQVQQFFEHGKTMAWGSDKTAQTTWPDPGMTWHDPGMT